LIRCYKYRIYPTVEQAEKINQTIGVCRLVYNMSLQIKKASYRGRGSKSLTAMDICYQLKDLRKDYPWVKKVNSQALQSSVFNVDRAFDNFFKGISDFPNYKKKKNANSFQVSANTRRINWKRSTLDIGKIPNIKIRLSQRFEGKIKTVTISRRAGRYFASISVNVPDILPPKKEQITPSNSIGIDIGIKSFIVTSDGRKYEANQELKKQLSKLKSLQRHADKKMKKGSKNKKKAYKKIANLHYRIANKRQDTIHKITHDLTHDNQVRTIFIEDLNVRGMLQNRKLSRAISDASFGMFFETLKYKCEWNGINLVKIGRFDASSKTCSMCGYKNEALTLADREWTCDGCGEVLDRDENAAAGVKVFGLKKVEKMSEEELNELYNPKKKKARSVRKFRKKKQTILNEKSGRGTSKEPVELSPLGETMKQERNAKCVEII
jgi:putative transposase